MKLIVEIKECEMYPPFYRIAWREYDRDVTIAAPIPLCYILNWGRALWHLTYKMSIRQSEKDRIFREGERKGIDVSTVVIERLKQKAYKRGVDDMATQLHL